WLNRRKAPERRRARLRSTARSLVDAAVPPLAAQGRGDGSHRRRRRGDDRLAHLDGSVGDDLRWVLLVKRGVAAAKRCVPGGSFDGALRRVTFPSGSAGFAARNPGCPASTS